MAVEAEHSCKQMQKLLTYVADVRNAHNRMMTFKAGNHSDQCGRGLNGLFDKISAKRKHLQLQQQSLAGLQHCLKTTCARHPQLADL